MMVHVVAMRLGVGVWKPAFSVRGDHVETLDVFHYPVHYDSGHTEVHNGGRVVYRPVLSFWP